MLLLSFHFTRRMRNTQRKLTPYLREHLVRNFDILRMESARIHKRTNEDLDDLSLSIVFIPIKSAWISRAKELVLRLNLYAADSHHVAAAILEKADTMITCDEKHLLRPKVRKEFKIVSPKEFLQEYGH